MSIKITVDRIIDKGEPRCKVLEVEALRYEELPTKYVKNPPNCFMITAGLLVKPITGGTMVLSINKIYDASEIDKTIQTVIKCGNKLARINKQIKELKKTWNGKVTYVI